LARIADDPAVPEPARAMFAELGGRIAALSVRLTALDRELARLHKSNPVSQLLAEIPGVGPISALSFALTVDVSQFRFYAVSEALQISAAS
jgi:transposase